MNMKKWLALAVACSTLALGACGGKTETAASKASDASAPAAPASDKVYRVAMNAEFAPFESLNEKNEVQGFDVDLMNAMAKAGNFKVEYKHQPWDSLFAALKNGDVDILASACSLFALGLLCYGGVVNVLQTLDTYSVATNVNMAFINGTLPIMALVGLIVELRSLVALIRRPASTFHKG